MEKVSSFEISMIGSETQETLKGQFRVKTMLTPRDILRADAINRELLGVNSEFASEAARITSFMLSQLSVRVVESPSWWRDASNGVDLEDMNVISEVFSKTMQAETDRKTAAGKAAEEVVAKNKKK